MTSRDFCYWLQGWFELNTTIDHREGATPETLEMIKAHLNLVFKHEIDPSIDKDHTPEEIDQLNKIHNNSVTLQELGEQYGFQVTEGFPTKFGPCPGPGYKLSTLHGWYREKDGTPRC